MTVAQQSFPLVIQAQKQASLTCATAQAKAAFEPGSQIELTDA